MSNTIYLAEMYQWDNSEVLRAFRTRERAEQWLSSHVDQYEAIDDGDDWATHQLGMGAKARFGVAAVDLETGTEHDAEDEL